MIINCVYQGTLIVGIAVKTGNYKISTMLTNYFKIAFRNLWNNKAFSTINIFGLAIGIATCLLIMLFVQNELGYDRFNEKADRIVRVNFRGITAGETFNEASVMPPVAQTFKNDFPEVEEATRIRDYGTPRLTYADKSFNDDRFAFVDSNFFQVFTLPLIQGNAAKALLEPNSVVITKAIAKKYFGNEDPIGKTISFKKGEHAPCKVTGVIDKVPVNSHFHFDLFASMTSLPEAGESTWMSSNFYTYLVLQKGYDYKKLEAKLPGEVEKYMGPELYQAMHVTLADFRKKGNNISFYLQPLTSIHLHSDTPGDLSPAGDVRYVYIFGAVAIFMLAIACINFMNLSTAGASKRSREVGIRKVLGSMKLELVKQFLFESIILTAIALVLAVGLMFAALSFFNQLSGQQLTLNFSDHPFLWPSMFVFIIVIGILAGSYPAFYLSSFNPVAVLKGKFTSGKKTIGLRSGLVVFQFFISIVLIVSTTIVYKQLSFIQNKKLGYDKDQVMILPVWQLGDKAPVFRDAVMRDPRVVSVTNSGFIPAGSSDNNNNFFVYPGDKAAQLTKTLRYEVDENYIPTLGMKLVSGRNFSKDFGTDSSSVIINETASRVFGFGENAAGHTISTTDRHGNTIPFNIIGVVKDFHFRSLHQQITPLVMKLDPNPGMMIVKLKTKEVAGLLEGLRKEWVALGSDEPFSYSFLDERFNNTYTTEQKVGSLLGVFAGLTIFVACLGLFGLAKFTAEQRTKEIGIRKVLGASVSGVAALLSKDFLKLVLLAFVIASPIAWYIMDKWLQDFAYRVDINIWVFLLAALLAVVITIITISFQAIRAAIANPIKSLRTE